MSHLRTPLVAACVAAAAAPLALGAGAAYAATSPNGALVSARNALPAWSCGLIADQKFSCNDASGAGFTVVLRPIDSISKWQDDPDLAPQIALQRATWFLTVQPNASLALDEFAAVKRAVAHAR